jgi:uracil-DNA glycosylase
VQPKLLVAMGSRTVEFVNALGFPLSEPVDASVEGVVRRFTGTIEVLVTPDIDDSLDEQSAKTRFWNAFKALGPWWAEQPPY